MAIVTQQQLEDAAEDALTLQEVANEPASVNGDGIIYSRLGLPIKVVQKVIEDVETAVAGMSSYNDRGPWLTLTGYAIKDLVQESGITYLCIVAHTSGTFATDLAAGKWGIFQTEGPEKLLSSYASLAAAVAAIGATSTSLVIDVNTTLTGNLTLPATMSRRHANKAVITVATYTLTDNSTINAGVEQLYDISGGGSVVGPAQSPAIYPQWFGAVGNGVADDTVPIQSALDFAAGAGRIVFFPPGTYNISSYLDLPSETTIDGAGDSSVIFIATADIAGLQSKDYATVQPVENVTIRNIKIVYEVFLPADTGKSHCIRFRQGTNIDIYNIFVDNSPLSSVDFSGCNDVRVRDSRCVASSQGFVVATGTTGICVTGNILNPNSSQPGYEDTSVYGKRRIGVDVGEFCYDIVVSNNVIHNAYYGIYLRDDSERATITGNTIKNCTDGIAVLVETFGVFSYKDITITGNVIEQASRTGMDLRTVIGGTVTGNTIRNCANNGIWVLSNNEHVVIANNFVSNCGFNGIYIFGNTNKNIVVNGNTCYHNGTDAAGYAGIYSAIDSQICNNYCYDDSSGQTQDYGIKSDLGNSTIDGNTCSNNLVEDILVVAGSPRGINNENLDYKAVGTSKVDVGKAWDGAHLRMGVYHLWLDSSIRLRVKNGAPASDTDGIIIGTQS